MDGNWKWLAGFMAAVFLVAGCGDSETPTDRCDRVCGGQELADSGCDKTTLITLQSKEVGAADIKSLRGMLELRRASGVCSHIYWTKFTPAKGNTEAFEVITVIGGFDDPRTQLSIPGKPDEIAGTRGFTVKPKGYVNGCVQEQADTRNRACFELATVAG